MIITQSKMPRLVITEASPIQTLRRSVFACMLWGDQTSNSMFSQIEKAATAVSVEEVAEVAVAARQRNLRRVAHLLAVLVAERHSGTDAVFNSGSLTSSTIYDVVERADDICAIIALWRRNNPKRPLSAQIKKGLATAFSKFGYMALLRNKNGRDGYTLRDAMFLVHPKPQEHMIDTFKKLADQELPIPNTWEARLSNGEDAKTVFTELLGENKLGALGLLRNLRNMEKAGVDTKLICQRLHEADFAGVMPFQVYGAYKFATSKRLKAELATSFDRSTEATVPKLSGHTVVLVDVSGSMNAKITAKSELARWDAASVLAAMLRSDEKTVVAFAVKQGVVSNVNGLADVPRVIEMYNKVHGGGTRIKDAMQMVNATYPHDRLILITDEQSHDGIGQPLAPRAYLLNVATYNNGLSYGKPGWTAQIDGFSESTLAYINELENG